MSRSSWTRKAQTSVEFIVLAGFMLIVFSGFVLVIKERAAVATQEARYDGLQSVAEAVSLEVMNANRVHDGYSRTFELPQSVNGEPYTISVTDKAELSIRTSSEEFLLFLPVNVTVVDTLGFPSVSLAAGQNTIVKSSDNITIVVSVGRSENVTCRFQDLTASSATCTSSAGSSCTATESMPYCTTTVSAEAGTTLTWTSSCGTRSTIVDGVDEEIVFTCPPPTDRITCVFLDNPVSGPNTCSIEGSESLRCTGTASCQIYIPQTASPTVTLVSNCRGINTVTLIGANPQASFFCRNN